MDLKSDDEDQSRSRDRSMTLNQNFNENPTYDPRHDSKFASIPEDKDPEKSEETRHDVCIVFPSTDGTLTIQAIEIVKKLALTLGRQNISLFRGATGENVFCLLKVSFSLY